jgi:dipeptidase D
MEIKHRKTKEILDAFEEIAKIPRVSKNEAQIAQWLKNWGESKGFEVQMDSVQNILIKVPSSPGYEDAPVAVLQGHMDMVGEKTPDSTHDFAKDPIKFVYEGEWLTADKTTLGADNGIAIAMSMVLATDKEAKHPPLELLFTVDEETGLTGANALKPGFIEGKILINIDSEDEGVFTVGCAGGINTMLNLPLDFEPLPTGYVEFLLKAGGMKGGHSGIDIALGKANAIQVLGRVLKEITGDCPIRISDLKGGSAHNAIPRDAEAIIHLPLNCLKRVEDVVKNIESTIKAEFKNIEPDLLITLESSGLKKDMVLTEESNAKLIDFILAIPHGVYAMSADIADLVETSNNFASISFEGNKAKILSSQRSSYKSRLKALTDKLEAVARISGGTASSGDGYPPWPANMDSPLLARCIRVYKKMYSKEPVVEIIHAGLECGIIGDKNEGMDMISIGPTLKYPHCPDEKIHIGTIGMVWDFLLKLLEDIK